MTPFTIRRAAIGDEPVVRALRIEALTESPWAFGSTLEREFGRTTADWQRWFSPGVTLIVEACDVPRGLVAGVHDKNRRGVVHLMAMWVHPALRGSGAADALVTALIDWAAAEGATEITLCIAKGNDRARRCYERHGFRATEVESATGRPGFVEVEMVRTVS